AAPRDRTHSQTTPAASTPAAAVKPRRGTVTPIFSGRPPEKDRHELQLLKSEDETQEYQEVAAGPSPYGTLPLPPPQVAERPRPIVEPIARRTMPAPPETPATMPMLTPVEPVQRIATQASRDVPLVEALRFYLDNRSADAVTSLSHYHKDCQEMLLNLLQLAARLTKQNEEGDGAKETAFLLEQLERLEVPLRARAELQVDKICFCRRIETFGVYEPLTADHPFRPGELVLVYVELRNFTSTRQEQRNDTLYTTHLTGSAEIRDEHGQRVWGQEFRRDRPDQSRTLRHDYFDNYRFCLPDLRPGLHTLWIKVTDVPTGRTVERSLDFHVKTAPAL
ncbi:MAG: hypothetical protein AB7K24_33025, partial [Gemmataceae bacterium]